MLSKYINDLEAALRCSGVLIDFHGEWDRIKTAALEAGQTTTNKPIMPCERHSCCNCGNVSCPLNGVNCSKFVPRTA
jgi:hypothetical protein